MPLHNLPVRLTSFIGREREVAQVKGFLSSTRLLTLTGTGGVGKTRLALQVAAEALQDFQDGVWVVDLAALTDPALVPQAAASILTVTEQPGRPLGETLAVALRDKALLLVMDNCEHLQPACAQLAHGVLRECAALRILATSRVPLGVPGELLWRVPSLSVPAAHRRPSFEEIRNCEAVRLFEERARASEPGFALTPDNALPAADVCRELDGIPLAIELAAPRVRVLTVEQIAARLHDRFRLLTGGDSVLPRHQTLRGTIDWSYELLSETERTTLRRLSVFAGGWTLEAAEAVGSGEGVEASHVLDLLTRLADKSLVVAETHAREARYRMLETIRQYALGKLAESADMARARGRHRDWYLQLAERANLRLRGPESRSWRDRLETEHDNLREALGWSRKEEGGAEVALRLAWALRWFWFLEGYWSEARGWFEAALAHSGDVPASALPKPLTVAAYYAYAQGDYERATALCEKGLALCRELGDKESHSWFAHYLGFMASAQGDYGTAAALHEEGLALSREIGDTAMMGFALTQLGRTAWRQGDRERATSLSAEGLALGQEVEDRWVTAYALCNLGTVALDRRVQGEAAAWFLASLAQCEEVGDRLDTRRCLEGLAGVACGRGEYERAARLFGAAQMLRERFVQLPIPPADRAQYERHLAALRAGLDETALAAAWSEGRAMTLDEAIAYAREADRPPPQPKGADPSLLTPREREVAALITQGLSNREIASRLVVSERTAETHVQNILNKLGFTSRVQVAAWAVKGGLSATTQPNAT